MKKLYLLIMILSATSFVFAQGYPQHVENIQRTRNFINRVSLGSQQPQVTNMMGEADTFEIYTNPSGRSLRVLRYLTDDSFQCLTDQHPHCYTPLIFENGVLIGKGQEYLDIAIKRYNLQRQF